MATPGFLKQRAGAQAGLLVLGASIVGHIGNYLYYVIAAQILGAARFAEVAAMIAFATILIWPVNGLQGAAARDVSRLSAAGDSAAIAGLLRLLLRRGIVIGLLIIAVLLAVSPLISHWLRLSTISLPMATSIWIVLMLFLLVGVGVIMGLQNFGRLAAVLAGPLGILRTALLPPLLLIVGLSGSIWAMTVATAIGLIIVFSPIRRAATAAEPRAATFRPGAVVVTFLAFAILTNLDQLIAKASLEPQTAGAYAGAALIGKIALYAPAALGLVLLPKAASAWERGERASRAVLLTLAVTLTTGLIIVVTLFLLPRDLLAVTFGPEFAQASGYLVPLSLVMTAAAVLQVHLVFAVARGSGRFALLMSGGAALQAGLLTLWHDTPAHIVSATAVAVGITLLIHEIGSEFGLVRMGLTGLRQRRS